MLSLAMVPILTRSITALFRGFAQCTICMTVDDDPEEAVIR